MPSASTRRIEWACLTLDRRPEPIIPTFRFLSFAVGVQFEDIGQDQWSRVAAPQAISRGIPPLPVHKTKFVATDICHAEFRFTFIAGLTAIELVKSDIGEHQ